MNGFPENVLLTTDGLESTTLASRAAVDLAKGGDAGLHVVHVWHTVPWGGTVNALPADATASRRRVR